MNRASAASMLDRSPAVIRQLDAVMGAEVTGLDVSLRLQLEAKRRLEDAFN